MVGWVTRLHARQKVRVQPLILLGVILNASRQLSLDFSRHERSINVMLNVN